MIKLNNVEQQIAEILVEAAKSRRTVSFTEIMKRVGIGRRNIGQYLSHIGHKCKELTLPVITVLVVYKGTNRVGRGYVEFESNFENNPALVQSETNKVWNNGAWSDLVENIVEIDGVWTHDIVTKEGATTCVKRNVKIRDMRLRNTCLELKGYKCCVCGFEGTKVYGKNFKNIIEVHHLNPIANGNRESTVDDLVPVCPNCHRALHSKPGIEPYTVEELKKIMGI